MQAKLTTTIPPQQRIMQSFLSNMGDAANQLHIPSPDEFKELKSAQVDVMISSMTKLNYYYYLFELIFKKYLNQQGWVDDGTALLSLCFEQLWQHQTVNLNQEFCNKIATAHRNATDLLSSGALRQYTNLMSKAVNALLHLKKAIVTRLEPPKAKHEAKQEHQKIFLVTDNCKDLFTVPASDCLYLIQTYDRENRNPDITMRIHGKKQKLSPTQCQDLRDIDGFKFPEILSPPVEINPQTHKALFNKISVQCSCLRQEHHDEQRVQQFLQIFPKLLTQHQHARRITSFLSSMLRVVQGMKVPSLTDLKDTKEANQAVTNMFIAMRKLNHYYADFQRIFKYHCRKKKLDTCSADNRQGAFIELWYLREINISAADIEHLQQLLKNLSSLIYNQTQTHEPPPWIKKHSQLMTDCSFVLTYLEAAWTFLPEKREPTPLIVTEDISDKPEGARTQYHKSADDNGETKDVAEPKAVEEFTDNFSTLLLQQQNELKSITNCGVKILIQLNNKSTCLLVGNHSHLLFFKSKSAAAKLRVKFQQQFQCEQNPEQLYIQLLKTLLTNFKATNITINDFTSYYNKIFKLQHESKFYRAGKDGGDSVIKMMVNLLNERFQHGEISPPHYVQLLLKVMQIKPQLSPEELKSKGKIAEATSSAAQLEHPFAKLVLHNTWNNAGGFRGRYFSNYTPPGIVQMRNTVNNNQSTDLFLQHQKLLEAANRRRSKLFSSLGRNSKVALVYQLISAFPQLPNNPAKQAPILAAMNMVVKQTALRLNLTLAPLKPQLKQEKEAAEKKDAIIYRPLLMPNSS